MIPQASDTGAEGRGAVELSLHQQYNCDNCIVHDLCDEQYSPSACNYRAHYPDGVLHPAAPHVAAEELRLPEQGRQWVLPVSPGHSMVVCPERGATPPVYGTSLRVALERGAPTASSPIAVLIGKDIYLSRVWQRRGNFGRELLDKGYVGVVAPAFSNWDSWTPFHNLDAIARSAALADLLARTLPTVPTLLWRTHHDLTRQVEWLCRGDVATVAIDFQSGNDRRHVAGVAHLRRQLADRLQNLPALLALGLFSPQRVRSLATAWPGPLVVGSQRPWHVAKAGFQLTDQLQLVPAPYVRTDELLWTNVKVFDRVVRRILREVHGPARNGYEADAS